MYRRFRLCLQRDWAMCRVKAGYVPSDGWLCAKRAMCHSGIVQKKLAMCQTGYVPQWHCAEEAGYVPSGLCAESSMC